MRPIRDFESYITEGAVKKQSPNHARARSLREESTQTEETLNIIIAAIGITDTNVAPRGQYVTVALYLIQRCVLAEPGDVFVYSGLCLAPPGVVSVRNPLNIRFS